MPNTASKEPARATGATSNSHTFREHNVPYNIPSLPNSNDNSLLIIDQDELNVHNESQVIKIIDDYDRRLQEQVTLAREDIVRELADKIQVSLFFCLTKAVKINVCARLNASDHAHFSNTSTSSIISMYK